MNKKYTAEELDLLHAELYDILGETIRVCQKHNIPYFVIGGTAIGALYDQAILPWDDDIDIGMTRENYNKFLKVAPGELGPSYFLSWIETDPHTPYYFAKVKKNDTLFVEEMFKNVPMHPGIFVDIFPFDKIPDNKLLRRIQSEALGFLKCCLMGKEIWMWKHFGTCEIENPTNLMFWKITIPLIRPILVYVMITSMIGGLQMFDVPQILTNGKGGPDRTSTTMIMYLNNHLFSKNYGMAGAVSVVLFLVCAVLCVVVYFSLTKEDDGLTRAQRKELNAAKKAAKGGK